MSKKKKKSPEKSPTTIVDATLVDVAFKAPVLVEDCKAVYDAIKGSLPNSIAEVYCHFGTPGDTVFVRVDNILRKVTVI